MGTFRIVSSGLNVSLSLAINQGSNMTGDLAGPAWRPETYLVVVTKPAFFGPTFGYIPAYQKNAGSPEERGGIP
jgi:hypothetical protein